MPRHFHFMPVDRTVIKTRLRTHPYLPADPAAFVRERCPSIRSYASRDNPEGLRRTMTFDVLDYKGIKMKVVLAEDMALSDITIEFNPGVCLFAHNGRIPTLLQFLDALGILSRQLTPLLANPEDAIDLIPGLRVGGVAYWDYMEIPFQCDDTDGAVLASFRHLRHPDIRKASRHWQHGMSAGPKPGNLVLSVYRKAVEMEVKNKLAASRLEDRKQYMRLEARMRSENLVEYAGSDQNVELIDGVKRLVRFYPENLVDAHRKVFRVLEGVYRPDDIPTEIGQPKPLAALGQMLARLANDPVTSRPFPELLALVSYYTGAADDTVKKIRNAGLAEVSRLSSFSFRELFSDTGYENPYEVSSPTSENLIFHDTDAFRPDRTIRQAYSPPDQPFRPHLEIEPYNQYPLPTRNS
ncbi:MAG: hypothetical protein EON58_08075 [Alphaproteobacteria bacterium]|nr:MAG: hypothetical protein EON58_08075 [Alphaproteobacteria bacterium]